MEGCELIEWGMGYNLRGMREEGENWVHIEK